MLFSSAIFIYFFLPLLGVYFLIPDRWKNHLLLAASLFFYFFGEPVYTLLLLFTAFSGWLHSLYIERHRGELSAKRALISSVVINIALLGFFKYADFFINTVNAVFRTDIPLTGIALPIGISFFTFQTMSYTIDVYRNDCPAQKNFATLTTFVALFPQLIAGPIVRYTDVAAELDSRKNTIPDISCGISRFCIGLGKKVLIANVMGELCAAFRAADEKSVLFYWIYALAFSLQIYFDFSGYSDMAIGLGHIFGFNFPENFNYPFISRSVTEFWRRWHMTLSSWFRDYLYIPLGGNRTTRAKWIRNIVIVWFITGFWHGAAWNFVLWGGIFAVFLILEKLWLSKLFEKLPAGFSHVYTCLVVLLSFVVFNADGLGGVVSDFSGLFGAGSLPFCTGTTLYYLKSYAVPIIIAAVGATPVAVTLWHRVIPKAADAVLSPVGSACILVASTAFIINGSFNPFLYFRF